MADCYNHLWITHTGSPAFFFFVFPCNACLGALANPVWWSHFTEDLLMCLRLIIMMVSLSGHLVMWDYIFVLQIFLIYDSNWCDACIFGLKDLLCQHPSWHAPRSPHALHAGCALHTIHSSLYMILALYLPYVQRLFTMTNNGNFTTYIPVAAYNS